LLDASPQRRKAHAVTKERKVRRWMLWAILGTAIIFCAFFSARNLLARTNDDKDPTIVGALALIQSGNSFGSPPSFAYVGNIRPAGGVIGVAMVGGPAAMTVRLLMSNVISDKCEASNGATIVSPPKEIGIDTAVYSLHQAHPRRIFSIDISVPAYKQTSVSCNVTDPPERETYTTRRIAFAPPLNPDIIAIASEGGFQPVLPIMASIQRVTESTGFNTIGGTPVHDHTIGSIM
jgi:hypothetical protein